MSEQLGSFFVSSRGQYFDVGLFKCLIFSVSYFVLRGAVCDARALCFWFAGYPYNLDFDYGALSQLQHFSINNLGDPFIESNYGVHSRQFEVGVLDWFARLWEIEKDEYWGYITNCGTEGNLHGILVGWASKVILKLVHNQTFGKWIVSGSVPMPLVLCVSAQS